MANIDSELAYFLSNLNRKFKTDISSGRPIPKEAIRAEVEGGPFSHLSVSDREEAIKVLEHNFTTSQNRGAAVFKDFKPWLNEQREEIKFYYWNRLQRYYLEANILPSFVVARLHTDTDEILDYLGNPLISEVGPRRGMVIGHVQSGKTTNYSALICKAADAGYRVIVLLAGITNSLRTQTQERIDETFIGRKSIFNPVVPQALPIQNYATEKRFPAYGTTRDKDFSPGAAGVGFNPSDLKEPIIFVLKKNKAPLERLRDWFIEQGVNHRPDLPLLLIDDEADNASINTLKDPRRTTAINGVIREILALFPRSAYLGYTATPFANIFIDPDTTAQMENDDIFPRHFIKALEAPSNYIGAKRMFADDGDLKSLVKEIGDYVEHIPLSHKRTLPLEEIPETLLHAIRVFCLTRGIRILRGQGKRHCSMMINVSRFNDVQEKVLGHVYQYLTVIRNAIGVNAWLMLSKINDPTILKIKESFDKEFSALGISFQDILRILPQATGSIQVLSVNMKGGKLEYAKHREEGLHVIAIGGLALSRGLTLEDLTVSYILRNTMASDTLMQMARWFGYRDGFEDICRLYLPEISRKHYKYVHEAIEELRTEVNRMQLLELTPEHFGLRVRQSDLGIKITAANKMRTASKFTVAEDYSARHVEGYSLPNDNSINQKNFGAAEAFIKNLGEPAQSDNKKDPKLLWLSIPGDRILSLIKNFQFSDTHADLGLISADSSLFLDYISDRLRADLSLWDVAIPQLLNGKQDDFAGHNIVFRSRESGLVRKDTYYTIGDASRVADPKDAQIALSPLELQAAKDEAVYKGDRRYCAHRRKPLLLIHLFKADITNKTESSLNIKGIVATLSFCMPPTSVLCIPRTYQTNKVYQRQIEMFINEPEDDDVILDETVA